MVAKNTALVVGANGVIGSNLIEHLEQLGNWEIIGLSRRGGVNTQKPNIYRLTCSIKKIVK